MALKLSLKPGERIVINGAVVANGDRRATLVLKNHAAVLRERDIMAADEAATPARRAYFHAMLAYIDEDAADRHYADFTHAMTDLLGVFERPEPRQACVAASLEMMNRNAYRALGHCRDLIAIESSILDAAASGGDANHGG